jgi:hypothetical protein
MIYNTDTPTWYAEAVCRDADPSIFYPERTDPAQKRLDWDTPLSYCRRCPVQDECLNLAMELESGAWNRHVAGMWGGKRPDERIMLRRTWGRAS